LLVNLYRVKRKIKRHFLPQKIVCFPCDKRNAISWRARWGWLAIPTTWTQCFSIFTNKKDDILPQKIVCFPCDKRNLISWRARWGWFFNLYLVKTNIKDDILPHKIVCCSCDKRNSMSWRARWGWLDVPTTWWIHCFSTFIA
jgi:hypothetical protein